MNYKYDIGVVDHKNIEVTSDKESELRFLMKIPIKNCKEKNSALFIMKNPSNADKEKSDKTLNNIIQFASEKYSTIYIANLYPYVNSDPKNIKDFRNSDSFNNSIYESDQFIKEILEKNSKSENQFDVICAWGTHDDNQKGLECYSKRTNEMLAIIKSFGMIPKAMRFSSSTNPWHPRNWEKNFTLELYDWTVQTKD